MAREPLSSLAMEITLKILQYGRHVILRDIKIFIKKEDSYGKNLSECMG